MDAFSIVYVQFWMDGVVEANLYQYLGVMKQTFGEPKEMDINPNQYEWALELLSSNTLHKQFATMCGIELHIHSHGK